MPDPLRNISEKTAPIMQWFHKPWAERLDFVTLMMREVSAQTEPESMVQVYGRYMDQIMQSHRFISLSRRDLDSPFVRITRNDLESDQNLNPWKHRSSLPVIRGGIIADLIYGEEAKIINDLQIDPDDPGYVYLEGMKSLVAIPLFDSGKALNMVILGRRDMGFSTDFLPEHVWLSNLFGRATANLVLQTELKSANDRMDKELKVVADIQRSLLPIELPKIPGLDIASYYQTSRHAGGDYYDFFELPSGKLGILIADVSGHGTPAAVMMAVTHSIAHTHTGDPDPPSKLLNFINEHLAARYTNGTGTFVTAFYGIYDPKTRELTFANAGHNPPRLKRGCGGPNGIIEGQSNLPLGIDGLEVYPDNTQTLRPGDTLVLYTDGITEARGMDNELYGTDRLDEIVNQGCGSSQELIDRLMIDVERFTNYRMPTDDRTILVMQLEG